MQRRHCLGLGLSWMATLGPLASHGAIAATPSNRRLPLVLAERAPEGLDPAPYLVSEKLDGVRAYWDGAALWFRSGLPIAAPLAFTAQLPAGVPLDGELWMGRGRFEALVAAVRRATPRADEWQALRYMAFELPGAPGTFEARAARLQALLGASPAAAVQALAQQRLPDAGALRQQLNAVVQAGGEGLMLHRADAAFVAGRGPWLLKLKPQDDAEAEVIAHRPGRGRLAGRLGALRVRTADGVVFDLGSGLSDAVRADPPPVGRWVTFTHHGLTERGVPRFARYLRERVL